MADNGERAEVRGKVAGQEFALVTKDLLPILLLLGIFVLGVLAWKQNEKRQDLFQQHHAKFYEQLTANRDGTHAEIAVVLRHIAIANWNCTHPEEQHIPLGVNGLPTPKLPTP